MRRELTWVETQLQSALTTIKSTVTTSLVKVAMFDTNSMEKKYQDYLESEQITIVFRELPGMLPEMPIADKTIMGNLFIYAPEQEKEVVVALVDTFISTFNATYQSMNLGAYKIKYRFTNLTPIGRADNKGSKFYQAWQFGVTMLVIDDLTTIQNRAVTFASNTVNSANGLINFRFEKIPVYAEYPISSTAEGKIFRFIKFRITFTVLDNSDTAVAALKALIYDTSYSGTCLVTSGSSSTSFTGKIISAIEGASEQGYPTLTFVIERG